MNSNTLLAILVGLVVGWFALGIIFNLRRGNAILRWMQTGLPLIGEKTTMRWLGTSVAEMVIAQAKKPFRQMTTLVVLVPRDVPWMWLFAWLQGRRDTLIFRGQLTSPPAVDLELADPSSWTGRSGLQQATRLGWETEPYQGLKLMAPRRSLDLARTTLESLDVSVHELSPRIWRLALRKGSPHLEIHIPFPPQRTGDARRWFASLQKLAQTASSK
jgi:hypothetical protein